MFPNVSQLPSSVITLRGTNEINFFDEGRESVEDICLFNPKFTCPFFDGGRNH